MKRLLIGAVVLGLLVGGSVMTVGANVVKSTGTIAFKPPDTPVPPVPPPTPVPKLKAMTEGLVAQAAKSGKAHQDAKDAVNDPRAVYDGAPKTYKEPTEIPERGVVTPGNRDAYVPKEYKSLHTNPPPRLP